jgi:hypothetical protein
MFYDFVLFYSDSEPPRCFAAFLCAARWRAQANWLLFFF